MAAEDFDLVVVGAGAAGMTAAATAAREGARVLLLEHAAQVGGTTAISGGMVWVPPADGLDTAREYLRATVPPGGDDAVLEAFLQRGSEAIRWLSEHTDVQLQPVPRYPDYEPTLPGATEGGRVLEPKPFDARVLGAQFALLRAPLPEFTLFGGMMIARPDIPHLRRAGRSARSAWHVAKLLLRHARERLSAPRGTTLVLGNALAGRLLHSVLQAGVELRTQASVRRLLRDGSRVSGVEYEHQGRSVQVHASRGVILASGGLAHDAELRARFLPPLAGSLTAAVGDPAARCGARLALDTDAALSSSPTQQALWVPASRFTRRDGSAGVYPHTVADRGKPGLIAVDGSGRRFVNEAKSYHHFVVEQLRAGPGALPAWLLADSRFVWRYGLGRIKPFTRRLQPFVDEGYLRRADSPAALATAIGVPPAALQATLERYNADARQGRDSEFGRGGDSYQRHLGDAEHAPNPNVAPIEAAPLYAVAVHPADLGIAAGLVTDAAARVRHADGSVVEGLFACGNDMQSVMNGAYPGPGITLGPALVFGWVAAMAALGRETR